MKTRTPPSIATKRRKLAARITGQIAAADPAIRPVASLAPAELVKRLDPSAAEYLRDPDLSQADIKEVERHGNADHPLRKFRKLGLLVLNADGSISRHPVRLSDKGKAVREILTR